LLLAVAASGVALGGEGDKATVLLSDTTPFAEGSGAGSKVKAECKLETKLGHFISEFAKGAVTLTSEPIDETQGRLLVLEIIGVVGPGGGAWSGAKSVTVDGKLLEDGEVVGTFKAARYSGGGAFGGYKGTCSILGRCVKAIGKDIAGWLKNPTMDALLGDAS
jgi:hypothetical protein